MSLLKRTLLSLFAFIALIAVLGTAGYAWLLYELRRAPADPQAIAAFFSQPASQSQFAPTSRQPCAVNQPLKQAWFGALHIHTAASFDATAFGVTNSADDAYAFSTGTRLEYRLLADPATATVPSVSIDRTLDFAAVTDHAGKLGERRVCLNPQSAGYQALVCKIYSSGRMWYPYSYRTNLSPAQQRDYAILRSELEPLAEIMQVKGDSECRNGLSSVMGGADELCDFEKLRAPAEPVEDCGEAFGSGNMRLSGCLSRFSYTRYALSTGLSEAEKLGVNPFRLGFIAATDNHNATPTASTESNYMGANGTDRTAAHRLISSVEVPGGIARGSPVRYNPGRLAGIWAEENSRQSLFSAMQRRETFGTSGPRIEPRFFAAWDLPPGLCSSPDMVSQGYALGVPMGGELGARPAAVDSPVFVASAVQDPNGNLLQGIQIIKGWVDDSGATHQAVYDIAGNRHNGASVDTDTCELKGPGYSLLCSTWQDPGFDAAQSAVYYSRVIENPSCRWSTFQCNKLRAAERPASCTDPDVAKIIQERAWTSPIWYHAAHGS